MSRLLVRVYNQRIQVTKIKNGSSEVDARNSGNWSVHMRPSDTYKIRARIPDIKLQDLHGAQ
jgi:hypothetical protein